MPPTIEFTVTEPEPSVPLSTSDLEEACFVDDTAPLGGEPELFEADEEVPQEAMNELLKSEVTRDTVGEDSIDLTNTSWKSNAPFRMESSLRSSGISGIEEKLEEDEYSGSFSGGADEEFDVNDNGNSTNDTAHPSQNSSNTHSDQHSEESLGIARKENKAVGRWRILLLVFLTTATAIVSWKVYDYLHNQEIEEYKTTFEADSLKIFDSVFHGMDLRLNAIDSFAALLVSSARENNQTWPFTAMPEFGERAAKARIAAQAVALQQYMYVEDHNREEWEEFSYNNDEWVQESIDIQRNDPTFRDKHYKPFPDYDYSSYDCEIWYEDTIQGHTATPQGTGPYSPTWQGYPIMPDGRNCAYNFNAVHHNTLGPGIERVLRYRNAVIGPVVNFKDTVDEDGVNRMAEWARRHVDDQFDPEEPMISVLYPVLDTANGAVTVNEEESKVVSVIAATYFWRSLLLNVLPEENRSMIVVFENGCNQAFSYYVTGKKVLYIGPDDYHDEGIGEVFAKMSMTRELERSLGVGVHIHRKDDDFVNDGRLFDDGDDEQLHQYGGLPVFSDYCPYTITTYPCDYVSPRGVVSNTPRYYTMIIASIFIFTALIFIGYDMLVAARQRQVMRTAVQSTTIVSSLFPSSIRDRLLEEGNEVSKPSSMIMGNSNTSSSFHQPTKSVLKSYLNDGFGSREGSVSKARPIADLFTDTTVMFADIAGFTAWSSAREPTQVFTLLETVYGAFDSIAARRGVFKVETIGDSYVAVSGLPDPRRDHAVVMAKFARDCRQQFNELCSVLERTLGPETGDLKLRIGLHSGAVTAGVLRGQKSRFQLFGDTVNTASRMESTGKVNKIQVSQATADILKSFRKGHWLQAREEMVEAKGKGMMITYWVEPRNIAISTVTTSSHTDQSSLPSGGNTNSSSNDTFQSSIVVSTQTERLVNWYVDMMERLLKKIVLRRIALGVRCKSKADWTKPATGMVLEEVKDVIELPEYNAKYIDQNEDPENVLLGPNVKSQLREYVNSIACTYHDKNPFHNFPHASHVGMSVSKLLSRIVAPDKDFEKLEQLHDHTYGITSDPLTQFACVFAALIHDVDHPGVPNAQLTKEDADIAKTYNHKSIAEQNSINLSWNILSQPAFDDLRKAIGESQQEAARFRQLVVNAVCATDIIDKDLKAARNLRWDKAFNDSSSPESSQEFGLLEEKEKKNRKATIVIEHIMQASDIAHTMQHWHIYIKWNERLYAEMYKAFVDGRAEKDPTDSWYEGEIGFFDFYIIPLAQKLSECGVFGVSSDEYLEYARMNRKEWENKGREVVDGYIKKYKTPIENNENTGESSTEGGNVIFPPTSTYVNSPRQPVVKKRVSVIGAIETLPGEGESDNSSNDGSSGRKGRAKRRYSAAG